ncbi:MAG: hypothetical protein NTX57_12045 [Armatimonadetes bacterium]|nr:hypothetical protein [Armatimonadota bacterium]
MSLAHWNEPLPEAEREALLEKISTQVVKRGLSVPAIIALEMHRPMAFMLSQSLIALTPLFGPLVGLNRMQVFGRLLAEPGGVEALIRRIEDKTI